MELNWDSLISPVDRATFERDYFARKPLSLNARGLPTCGLETIEGWRKLLAGQAVRRQGQRTVVDLDPNRPRTDVLAPELEDLLAQGGPLIVNGVNLMNPAVQKLADAIAAGLGGRAVVNGYISPNRKDALDLHADDHEVVVLQLCGTKHWTVGTKIVRGLAHSSLFAIDNASVTQLARERDQFRNIDLEEGGLLYVPRGLAHRATAQDTYSIHLSVGVFRATGLDFAEFVLKYLIGDIAVRDYFAHPGRSGITPAHTEFMDSIAEKLAVLARDEQLRSRFLELRQREAGLGEPKDT